MSANNYHIKVPEYCREVIKTLKSYSFSAFAVGGAVRDFLMGRDKIEDWDVATSARPHQVIEIFEKTIPTGLKHGTVTVLIGNQRVEVTSFRKEGDYLNGRHPKNVDYVSSIIEDVKRRDFTINAIAYDPIDNVLIDEFNGLQDIEGKIIRAVGDPYERIREDYLRMLRAIRFSAQLGFDIETILFKAIKDEPFNICKISNERICDEFEKILLSQKPSTGIDLMRETGLLKYIIPELLDGIGVVQDKGKCSDVYEHNLVVCDLVPPDFILRATGLFHDIGKPDTKKCNHFYYHEKVGAEKSKDILKRLRVDLKTIEEVSHLISHHMINYDRRWNDSAVRRYIKRVGKKHLKNLYEIKKADIIGTGNNCEKYLSDLEHLYSRIQRLQKETIDNAQQLNIDGYDIMSLGVKEGPQVGIVLNYLLEIVLEDPSKNNKDSLLKYAKEFARIANRR